MKEKRIKLSSDLIRIPLFTCLILALFFLASPKFNVGGLVSPNPPTGGEGGWVNIAQAATINAVTCEQADVQSSLSRASVVSLRDDQFGK